MTCYMYVLTRQSRAIDCEEEASTHPMYSLIMQRTLNSNLGHYTVNLPFHAEPLVKHVKPVLIANNNLSVEYFSAKNGSSE